jgi:HSP20 family protein
MSKVTVNKPSDNPSEHRFLPAEFSWSHLEKMFRDMRSHWPFHMTQPSPFKLSEGGMLNPQVDIKEVKDAFKISVELPGIEIEDIDVEVSDSEELNGKVLIISGKKESEKSTQDEDNYYLMERNYGYFRRSFALPNSVDEDNISANFKNGVLHVVMPKDASSKQAQKKIKIDTK